MTAAARQQLAGALRATKRGSKRVYIEDKTQADSVGHLRTVLKDAIVFAIPNGGLRLKREAAKLKWTGVLAGVPDVCIIAPGGRAFFIEFKSPKGALSPEQEALNTWFALNGVPYCVARSVDDVRVAIAAWKLQSREAA